MSSRIQWPEGAGIEDLQERSEGRNQRCKKCHNGRNEKLHNTG